MTTTEPAPPPAYLFRTLLASGATGVTAVVCGVLAFTEPWDWTTSTATALAVLSVIGVASAVVCYKVDQLRHVIISQQGVTREEPPPKRAPRQARAAAAPKSLDEEAAMLAEAVELGKTLAAEEVRRRGEGDGGTV